MRRRAALVERRGRREPLAYILGEWGFRRLTLRDRRPRARAPARDGDRGRARARADRRRSPAPRVVDVGTGSGAIALAIAQRAARGAVVTATDVSSDGARARARERRAARARRSSLVETQICSTASTGPFDLVVSNPPYVDAGELDGLPAGGARLGAAARARRRRARPRTLVRSARDVLAPGGVARPRMPRRSRPAVAAMLEELGYAEATDHAAIWRDASGWWRADGSRRSPARDRGDPRPASRCCSRPTRSTGSAPSLAEGSARRLYDAQGPR